MIKSIAFLCVKTDSKIVSKSQYLHIVQAKIWTYDELRLGGGGVAKAENSKYEGLKNILPSVPILLIIIHCTAAAYRFDRNDYIIHHDLRMPKNFSNKHGNS